jgi:FOG: Ankyrin repeat
MHQGIAQSSAIMHQALAKSSALIHAVPVVLQKLSQQAVYQAHSAYNKIAQASHLASERSAHLAKQSSWLPGTLLRNSQEFVKNHPKQLIIALGTSLGTLGGYMLINSTAFRNAANRTQQYLAHSLLGSNNLHLIEWALQHGADINAKFRGNKTAMHLAAEKGRADIVEYLIRNGAKYLFGDDYNILLDGAGLAPIHYAAQNGHINVIECLVRHSVNINSAIHSAAAAGQLETVHWLVQHGADDKLLTPDNQTPLAVATRAGRQDVVLYLEQIRPPRVANHRFTQVLHGAIDDDDAQRARLAINSGAYLVAADESQSPLRRTIKEYNAERTTQADEIAEELVLAGAPLHTVDTQGNTPLHLAVRQGNERLARLFIRQGANARARNTAGQEALDIAMEARNQGILELLGEHLPAKHINTVCNRALRAQKYCDA